MKNTLLKLITSISTITLIAGCNNNIGGSSATNPQKSQSAHSLTSGDNDKNEGSLVFMYKGAPIKQNRQLIFKTDDLNEIVTNVTTTNPDSNGKVYAIINTSPITALNHYCNEISRIYQIDLTADNPMFTKRQFDQFYFRCNGDGNADDPRSNLPVVNGFFSNGNGFVGEADAHDNVFSAGALHIYRNYQPVGYNTTFFHEQIRSITVTADDSNMFVATNHHLYQVSKGDMDSMSSNFDSSPNNPFHEVASIRDFLQQKNEEIQAIKFDSFSNGYIYTRKGNLYSVTGGNVINQDNPTHLFNTAESTAPYVTSINFENPIFSRAIAKGNNDDSVRQQWLDSNLNGNVFSDFENMVENDSGFLISLSCGASCNQELDNALNQNSYNPMDMASFGLTKIIEDIFDGNLWSWDGFLGDTLMFAINSGVMDHMDDAIDAAFSETQNNIILKREEIVAAELKRDDVAAKFANLNEDYEQKQLTDPARQDYHKIASELNDVTQDLFNIDKVNDIYAKSFANKRYFGAIDLGVNLTDGGIDLIKADFLAKFNNDYSQYAEYLENNTMNVFSEKLSNQMNTYTEFDYQTSTMSNTVLRRYQINSDNGANVDPRLLDTNHIRIVKDNIFKDLTSNVQFRMSQKAYLTQKLSEAKDLLNSSEFKNTMEYSKYAIQLEDACDMYEFRIMDLNIQLNMLTNEQFDIIAANIFAPLGMSSLNQFASVSGDKSLQSVSLPGQSADDAKHNHGYITGSFLDLNQGILYKSESGGFDMLQDYTNQPVDNLGVNIAFDGKTQYTVVGYAPYGTAYRLYFQNNIYH